MYVSAEASGKTKLTEQEAQPLIVPTHKAACGHALLFLDEKVTAVADLSTDWRFAKNDIKGDFKVCPVIRYRDCNLILI
jgi:N-acetyl-gamma-glutamylphosphate reductase